MNTVITLHSVRNSCLAGWISLYPLVLSVTWFSLSVFCSWARDFSRRVRRDWGRGEPQRVSTAHFENHLTEEGACRSNSNVTAVRRAPAVWATHSSYWLRFSGSASPQSRPQHKAPTVFRKKLCAWMGSAGRRGDADPWFLFCSQRLCPGDALLRCANAVQLLICS